MGLLNFLGFRKKPKVKMIQTCKKCIYRDACGDPYRVSPCEMRTTYHELTAKAKEKEKEAERKK